jgi:hypothetical protein
MPNGHQKYSEEMSCPLCRQRKPRRTCPALGQQICAVCCGTKRLVEINCPSDCVYLEAAERHPAAVVKRRQEHDIALLMSALGRLSQGQLQSFFVLQAFVTRFAPSGLLKLVDADVAEAASALASTLETAERGVVYEHQCASPVAEELRRGLRGFLAEIGKGGGSRFEREAAVVLRGIERGARHDVPGLDEGDSTYLTLVRRVLQERPGARADEPSAGSARPDEPRIVITG